MGRSVNSLPCFSRALRALPGETMRRAKAAGVTSWAEIEGLSPCALEARLYPSTAAAAKPTPDCAWIHRERRRVGVTLQLLHDEYAEQQPDGYKYSQFCEAAGRRVQEDAGAEDERQAETSHARRIARPAAMDESSGFGEGCIARPSSRDVG